eukprot:4987299-Pleurochrysis_carterae.AAC.1
MLRASATLPRNFRDSSATLPRHAHDTPTTLHDARHLAASTTFSARVFGHSSACLNRKLANGLPQPLVLFHHPRKGWGVRTAVELKKGEFVCEYVGELVSAAEADRRAERCPDAERYFMALKPSDKPDGHYVVIDAYAVRNVAAFINFSCKPNLRKVSVPATHADSKFPRVGFVAID